MIDGITDSFLSRYFAEITCRNALSAILVSAVTVKTITMTIGYMFDINTDSPTLTSEFNRIINKVC